MKIGELAKTTGTQIETIRYYEREGLLTRSRRTHNNYRVYDSSDAARLSFIRYCRKLDMTLDEIRVLLRFKDAPGENCGEVNALLDEHIGHVDERIRELRSLERQLKSLRALCHESKVTGQCGILNELSHVAPRATVTASGAVVHLGGVHGGPQRHRRGR